MRISDKLDALISQALADEIGLDELRSTYETLFNGTDGNSLNEKQECYYGQIHTKLEFTCSYPIPAEEVKYGYLTYEQFKLYVKDYLANRPG